MKYERHYLWDPYILKQTQNDYFRSSNVCMFFFYFILATKYFVVLRGIDIIIGAEKTTCRFIHIVAHAVGGMFRN